MGFFAVVVLALFENLEKVQIALNTNEGERNGSVVKCLTQDREAGVRVSPASLQCGP